MDRVRNLTPTLALSIGLLLSAKGTAAHGGHNMEKIVEGEAMSVDPIVRGSAVDECVGVLEEVLTWM
jgi:hypothetical protein